MGNKAKTIVKGCKGEIRRKEWGETGGEGDGRGWGVGVTIIHYSLCTLGGGVHNEQTKLIKKKCQRERNLKENLPSASSLVPSLTA